MHPKKNTAISELKVICLMLVIISHCVLFYVDNPYFLESADFSSHSVTFIYKLLDAVMVPGFVLASGFLFMNSLNRRNRSFGELVAERSKRLLVPYYIYGAIWLVPLYTLFDIRTFGRFEDLGLLAGCREMLLGNFSDHLWFLWMLVWVTLFFIVLKPLLSGKKLIITGILTFAAAVLVCRYLQWFPYFKLSQIGPYLICFFAGIVLRQTEEKSSGLSVPACFGIAAVLQAAVIVYAVFSPAGYLWDFLFRLMGSVMMYFFFLGFSRTSLSDKMTSTKHWRFLEEKSMNIYLLNCPFMYLWFRVIYPYIGQHVYLTIICLVILSFASIFTAVWIQGKIKAALFKSREAAA